MNDSNFPRVVECIARTTRYPAELLTPDADLENDLGIDSVKRLEIVVALSDEFGLRLDLEERSASIRTIQHVATWVQDVLHRESSIDARPTIEETGNHVTDQHASTNDTTNRVASLLPPPESHGRITPNGHDDSNHYAHAASSSQPPQPHFRQAPQLRKSKDEIPKPTNGSSTTAAKSLAGRVALVTGSGRGVGKTIARLLASKGATVIINSFHSREQGDETAAEINQAGGSAIHLWGSVANPRQVDHIFEQIEQQFGRLDILICNASNGRIGPFMELTLDDWDKAFRTNVTGHHQCAVKAAPLMRASGGGSIVTMSAVGSNGYIDGLGSQGVVKAAVETMTKYLACELGQFGIRVNCVAGGPVYGDLLSKFPGARSTQDHWESITPDGQLCSPMDLANAIVFLVGDDAKGINGSVWMVDHGFSAMADGRPLRATARESLSFAT